MWYLWRGGGRKLLSRCWYASVLWNSKLNNNSRIGVLFGELMIIQLAKKFPVFHETGRLLLCTGPSPDIKFIYITSHAFYYTRNISALFPHRHLDHSSLFFITGFPTNFFMRFTNLQTSCCVANQGHQHMFILLQKENKLWSFTTNSFFYPPATSLPTCRRTNRIVKSPQSMLFSKW